MPNKKNVTFASFIPFIPLYAAVPLLYAWIFHSLGEPMSWGAFGLGALGWFIALILRGPVAAITSKLMTPDSAKLTVILSSGPLEESVRLILLALTSLTLSNAVSIGQGWAAIEVLYAVINTFAIITIVNRKDEKAAQALHAMEQQGMRADTNPIIGVIERITASAYHIGATLLIACHPWLVIVMIPLHSILNIGASYILKRFKHPMLGAQLFVGLIGAVSLVAGWLVW